MEGTDVICYGYTVRRLMKGKWLVLDPNTQEPLQECFSYQIAEKLAQEKATSNRELEQ